MIRPLESFKDSSEIRYFAQRVEFYNDNTYRLNDTKGALEHLVKPIYDDLTLKKMYLIAEDTCFDYLGTKYIEEYLQDAVQNRSAI